MSLSHQSFSFTQPENHSNSVYSFFSIATDLMTYWWGGNNPAVTAEVQSLIASMQHPEDLVEMPSVDQDAQRQERLARRLIGPEGMEFQVNTYTTSDQSYPAVAALTNGGFVVTWMSYGQDGDSWGVYGQRHTASGAQNGGEFRVNSYTTSDQFYPAVAALSDGGFVVTWTSNGQNGSDYGVYGQRYTASGAQSGGEFRVNSYTTSYKFDSAVAALTDGGFVVTWTSNEDGDAWGVYGQRYTASGAQSGGEFRVNSYTTSDQRYPAVAALTDGGFVVTWMSYGQDGDSWGVYGQHYTASGAQSWGEFRVNNYTTGYQGDHAVAALTDGSFVVTWVSDSGSVYGQCYTASGAQSGREFRVNSYTTSYKFDSAVAALTDGGFVVTWTSNNGGLDGDSYYGVYGQRYTASGAQSGGEFRVNSYTTSDQRYPAVAALTDGGFVVTWVSFGQDGSGYGVYGQRFDANGQKRFVFTSAPTFSPTSVPTFAPTFSPTFPPTFSPTFAPNKSSSGLSNETILIITITSIGGLAGLIAAGYLIVRYYRQRAQAKPLQSGFDPVPVSDPSSQTQPVRVADDVEFGRGQGVELVSRVPEQHTPCSLGESGETSHDELRVGSPAQVVMSTIQLIRSTELHIDVTQCLGEGGFGIVYKGSWQETPVAVKRLKAKHLPKIVLESFYQEAMHHDSFKHPNILRLYGVCLDASSPSMVMELMTISLYHFLHSYQDFPWSMRLSVAKDIASGLQYLHSRRALHRDLKSHNVLLDQNHQAKLSDFGLSKTRSGVSSSLPTAAPAAAGTLHWMAPEILGLKAKHTERSDVYALGMVFWEISSRQFPFQEYENSKQSELLRQSIREGERPTIPQETPPTFAALIARCWAQRAEDRPVCTDIVKALRGEATPTMSSLFTLYGGAVSGNTLDNTEIQDPFLSITNTGSL